MRIHASSPGARGAGHLTDAFLLSTVPLATDSERKRNSNPRKIYPADPGLIPAFDASGRANLGHSLETAVLNELERRRAEAGYVKTADGLEVDFLVRYRNGEQELVQVCANLKSPETVARELRALAAARGAADQGQASNGIAKRSSRWPRQRMESSKLKPASGRWS